MLGLKLIHVNKTGPTRRNSLFIQNFVPWIKQHSSWMDERDYPSMLKRNLIYVTCSKWSLQWRHNGQDSVSNHQPHECLLNRIFRRRSKKTSKLRVTGLCVGNSSVTGEFPHKWPVTRKMSPFWWLHHVIPGEEDGRHWVAVCGAPTQS